MKEYLQNRILFALKQLHYDTAEVKTAFEKPKIPEHGDIATNIALLLSKSLRKDPREIAGNIVRSLDLDQSVVTAEVAGPGFINFRFADKFFLDGIKEILKRGEEFGRSGLGGGRKTQVEFVSANPTGLLHLGHGRQAAIGDTIANLLRWVGYDVTREYYFNNAGRQMRILGESVYARYMQISDLGFPLPEDGYQGEYIREIARKIHDEQSEKLRGTDDLRFFIEYAENYLFGEIKKTLARLGVNFDVFYNEDSLYTSGKIYEVVDELREKGLAYDKDGAVWFKATSMGLDQDRVIIKSTGEPTYRLPDIAYHREKFKRGFDLIVDIFGADHVSTYPDVLAGVKALGYDPDKIKVLIHQFVTLTRGGEQVKMSKRKADYVTLDELIDEVGPDVVRFFFIMRGIGSHLEFDLDLAKEQSDKNPVYYLQYAHARIASIIRFAQSEGVDISGEYDLSLLKEREEAGLSRVLLEFPEVVETSAATFEPHRLPVYLAEVAEAFHRFYHRHRVVTENRSVTAARMALCQATKTVLANGLKILGVSAPEKM
jgi:arginyl-tRNA synthetase